MAKRILSLFLCLALMIGMVPAFTLNTSAAEDTIYLLAGGDFQEAGDHSNSAKNVTDILAQISNAGYSEMDGFLFIGDYDCETHNDSAETAAGITALMGAVQSKYSNINDANSILIQGNHDYLDSRIDATGGHDMGGYSVFVLNEYDYPNGGGSASGIQALATQLETWLDAKISEGYDAPIFITSHLPLAFTPRTVTQGDAMYAKYIFDVLNNAGKEGLNIIFMHGHDHAYGPDNYMGGEAIYLVEGDKICIAEAGSISKWTEETLSFTYMNAGYTGYYSDAFTYITTAGTEKLTMTVFAITGNNVTVERYSANGVYNLKSAGYDGSYSNTSVSASSLNLPFNSTVYTSPQTITLTNLSTGDDVGTIGNYVAVTKEATDDVTTSGNKWVTITEPTGGTTTYTYTLDTDGTVDTDVAYLLVGNSTNSAITKNDSNAITSESVEIISDGTTIKTSTKDNEWFIDSNNRIYTYIGETKYYLRANISFNGASLSLTTSTSGYGSATIWNINANYTISYRFISTNYFITIDGLLNGDDVNSSNRPLRLFMYDSNGDAVTGATPGLYYYVDGNLSYNITDLGVTDAEAVLAKIKENITIKKATLEDYSDEAVYEGEDITWTLDPAYDGKTPGDYAVTIAYNGTTLGTAEVIIPESISYYKAEGNGLYVVEMDTTADVALSAVKAGVTVYKADDVNGTNKTVIDDSDVTWNWIDNYDGKNVGPYTVEILYDGVSLGTVEVKVNVQYNTGLTEGWVHVGTTSSSYSYVLDTDGIDYGESNKYIIVDDNEAIVLHANSSSNGTAQEITISGNTATTTTRDYEYHMVRTTYNGTRYELITKGDGSQYLYQESNGVRYGTRSSVKFQVNHHGNGVYDIHDIDGTNWYIIYNGGWTVTNTTSARVRLYKYEGVNTGGNIYAHIEGDTTYHVALGKSSTSALNTVKTGITGYIATDSVGSDKKELNDSELTWTWLNKYNGNVTGSYWVQISYNGEVLGTVKVVVQPGVVNHYPEYPNEGAVKVDKTATGIDFQSSGVAQVELSVSGVPSKKGVDVIIMLDTSSSMAYCLNCNNTRHDSYKCDQGGQTRAQALEATLANLIKQFKTPGDDGELLDIDVAIADFNGFYGDNHSVSGTAYDRDAADMMSDDISYTADSEAMVYTSSSNALDASAFVSVSELASSYSLNYTSGTNYDYAMDAIYQMASAKKEANGSEDRDLFVIFLSDGAAMQWNGYHSQGGSNLWENWITGKWTANQLTTANLNCTTHAYYYDEVDHDGDGNINEHRMANAIKGDPSETYEVIRKVSGLGTPTDEDNMYLVPGLGATMFSIAFDPRTDNQVDAEFMVSSIKTLASDSTESTDYFYNVSSANELDAAFNVIGTEISYAATNAHFEDQMGEAFDIQLEPVNYLPEGETDWAKSATITPEIKVLSYDIITRQEYLDSLADTDSSNDIKESQIGDREVDANGNYISTVIETVKFTYTSTTTSTGKVEYTLTGATSSLIDEPNIMKDGVIYAKSFAYNTTDKDVIINGNTVVAESFYWYIGTVSTSEIALNYYVYLTGSMEGKRNSGSYPTNNYATLYYTNYLGKDDCYKDTVSPELAWESASVKYAFYLVNKNGQPVNSNGEVVTFANKVDVTQPVIYEEILLNDIDDVSSIDVRSISTLPEGYTLYDNDAVYTVSINSNSTGSWVIDVGTDASNEELAHTTYVTDFSDKVQYSNELSENETAYDYTNTTVWFAVVWIPSTIPDAVVVDFGLPVDISVLTNDQFGDYGSLVGVMKGALEGSENILGDTTAKFNTTSVNGDFGSATVINKDSNGTYLDKDSQVIRYIPSVSNGMQMTSHEVFTYSVYYNENKNNTEANSGYYYGKVTVIPATTIYYEDNFLTYDVSNTKWEDVTDLNKPEGFVTQAEDRPGFYSLVNIDANNVYGYDEAYDDMSLYSLGSAKKVTVDADSYATASFTFYGTGFDIISLTSNKTGTLAVKVTAAENILNADDTVKYASGEKVKATIVNTYYGYTKVTDADGKTSWVTTTSDDENAIYQIPVIQIENLPYAKYNVVLTATYADVYNLTGESGFDLYLDAVRVYDPAGVVAGKENATIEKAYNDDKEAKPVYLELRNQIIKEEDFDALTEGDQKSGIIFIDQVAGTYSVEEYSSYGPNNELYLAKGQSVAFELNAPAAPSGYQLGTIQLGMKSVSGTGDVRVYDPEITSFASVTASQKINTATDMYYEITSLNGGPVVISNASESDGTIISITNIKFTYTPAKTTSDNSEDNVTETASIFSIRRSTANAALMSLAAEAPEEDTTTSTPEIDDTTSSAPEVDDTTSSEPEEDTSTSTPETNEPEEDTSTSTPETSEPETDDTTSSKPEEKPITNNPIINTLKNIYNKVTSALSKLFGRWFS